MAGNLYRTAGEFTPDSLIAGNAIPITTKGIKVAAGQGVLKRGTLLGQSKDGYKMTGTEDGEPTVRENGESAISEDGESTIGENGKTTISEDEKSTIGCDCILTDDVDATETDVVTTAYVSGTFNRAAIILAEGAEIGSYETELRKLGIFLNSVQEY